MLNPEYAALVNAVTEELDALTITYDMTTEGTDDNAVTLFVLGHPKTDDTIAFSAWYVAGGDFKLSLGATIRSSTDGYVRTDLPSMLVTEPLPGIAKRTVNAYITAIAHEEF
jgi:hypothetical protein